MNKIKVITLGVFFVIVCSNSSLFAQNHFDKSDERIAKMTDLLKLNPEQVEQVKAIQEKFAAKRQELEAQNFTEKRELRQEFRAEMAEVLTEEQMTLLQEKRTQRRNRFRQHRQQNRQRFNGNGETRKTIKKEIHQYVKENALPLLKTQRRKLDHHISVDDQVSIEAARIKMAELKSALKKIRKDLRPALTDEPLNSEQLQDLETLKENFRQERQKVRALADKYSPQIQSLKTEIEADIQQWKTDVKGIIKQHIGENDFAARRLKHRKRGRRSFFRHKALSKVGFLLLDPDKNYSETEWQEEEIGLDRSFNVFPNPSTQTNTIEFEVQKPGNVRIDLMSRNGAFIRTILEEYKMEGVHQIKVDVTNLNDRLYYYVISDENGQTTKEFLIK